MNTLIEDMQRLGNAATRQHLQRLGHTKSAIANAIADSTLTVVSRSWVVTRSASPRLVTALEVNGLVGGSTALRSYGVWITTAPEAVVSIPRKRNRPTVSPETKICRGSGLSDARYTWRVPLAEALLQYLPTASEYDAVATVDSALNQGLVSTRELNNLLVQLPRRVRRWLARCDRRAESGLETILRLACLDEGWTVEIQYPLPWGGRVDMVINGWLYIEIDGSEFHDVAAQASLDRERNHRLAASGQRMHRLSYRNVVHELTETMATLRVILADGNPNHGLL